jgi:prevent-host-death family protein
MRSHTELSLRQTKASLSWVVSQVERGARIFVITKDGEPAAAVVPFAVLAGLDARSAQRGRKVARLLRQLAKLMPGAATKRAR